MNPRFYIGVCILLLGLSILFGFPLLKTAVALAVIWVGIRMMIGKNKKWEYQFRGETGEDVFKRVLICSGIRAKLVSRYFEYAEITAICGGGEVDFSSVKTTRKEVEFNIVAIVGGLKVKLPKEWAVRSEGVGIVGGYDNKTKSVAKAATTAVIKGTAIVGGVEIVQ